MRDYFEVFGVGFFVILVIAIPTLFIEKYQCNVIAQESKVETKYEGFQCFVKSKAGFITLNQYDNTFIASESKQ